MLKSLLSAVSVVSVAVLIGGCAGQAGTSFKAEVKPVLDKHCASCHSAGGDGTQASGFEVTSYDSLMKGTQYGPVVVAGDAASSSLYRLVSGKVDASIQMPHGEEQLSDAEIAVIESWIDQGAKNN